MNIYICIYIYLINSNGGNCQTLCPSPAEAWEPSPGLKWISQSRMLWVQALSELQMAGSRAFHGALRDAGKPSLPGVNHMKEVFTPIARVLKSSLD